MRENKYERLLNVSIAVLIVSAVMLAFTAYNVFYKQDASAAPVPKKDSLDMVYKQTIAAIDPVLIKAAYADTESRARLSEMNTLRKEIDSLLLNRGSETDLASAKVKIEELQYKVKSLQDRYADVAGQNKELRALLNRLIAAQKTNTAEQPVAVQTSAVSPGVTQTPARPAEPASRAAVASAMKLLAASGEDDAESIQGSFVLQTGERRPADEIMIIVQQPDGKTIRHSVWESGTFISKEGKKIYSRKISADPDEPGKVYKFTVNADRILEGNYTLEVWYKGALAGRVSKGLV